MKYFEMTEETATYASEVFTLTGAVSGRQSFSDAGISSDSIYYRASNADGSEWEIGIAYESGGDLIRSSAIERAAGFVGEFTSDVTIACVAPGKAMPVIDRSQATVAVGDNAMAEAGGSTSADYAYSSGWGCVASHEGSRSIGVNAQSFSPYAERFFSAFRWAGNNDTSGAETLALEAGGWSGPMELPEYGAAVIRCQVVGIRDIDSACYSAEITACVRNVGGTTSFVGSPTTTEVGKTSGVTVSAALTVGASGDIAVSVTGAAGQDWRWSGLMTGAVAGV